MQALGYTIWMVSGFIQWIYFFGVITDWFIELLGVKIIGIFVGFNIAIMCTPGVFIFPLIYKLIEGSWPTSTYFILFVLMYFGAILTWAGAKLTGQLDDEY